MKQYLLLLVLIFISLQIHAQTKVMTFNIRYSTPNDKENSWENRKDEVIQLIDYYKPAFLGIQEGTDNQVAYLDHHLQEYSYVGIGREGANKKGEFVAIFYDITKFEVVASKTFWLSQTPDTVSKGWDAAYHRIATYGVFKDKTTRDTIHIFNCHFDHIGNISRKKSAELLLHKINEFGLEKKKLIVMGDLNCEPKDEPIQILTTVLDDAIEISQKKGYGPVGTFNGFDNQLILNRKIDYIFTKNIEVLSYRHIDDRRTNTLYISDHLPVMIQIKNTADTPKR